MQRLLAGLACGRPHLGRRLPALAALKVGDKAPDFTAPAALAGNDFSFTLSKALKKGPVVLYFFPAAYTSGCTAEAHEFAEATPEFEKLGATVIGVTGRQRRPHQGLLQGALPRQVRRGRRQRRPDQEVRRGAAA
jgi:peroxiredoxin Q/BCP